MIPNFPPPWNFKLAWIFHKGKVIPKFPPPWNFKLTWIVHKDKVITKFPTPWNFKIDTECPQGEADIKFYHLHGT